MEDTKTVPNKRVADPAYAHYGLLAEMLMYPDENLAQKTADLHAILKDRYPDAAEDIAQFEKYVCSNKMHELQEIFLRSFDVQAITTLDIGYVLFGDDYKRGAMLVNMNREHLEAGNPCYDELADHLPNVLRLIPLLEDAAFRLEMMDRLVAPALRKIIREFQPSKIDSKQKVYRKHHKTLIEESKEFRTIYRKPLHALNAVIEADFELTVERAPEASSDFLKKIGTEIKLETESETPNITQSCSH